MIHVMIPFEVQEDALDKVKAIIQTFIKEIKHHEPDTLMYRSYQEKDAPTKFVHVMTFKNEEAQRLHRETDYCREFVSKLYPLCTKEPQAKTYDEIEPIWIS